MSLTCKKPTEFEVIPTFSPRPISKLSESSRRAVSANGALPFIEIYTRPGCVYCLAAIKILNHNSLPFFEHDTTKSYRRLALMREKAPGRTFPQIVINGQWIGGFDDLLEFDLEKANP